MHRISAILFVIIIIYQAFYNLGVTMYWLANRTYIAAELCINRDKPQMHCDGKCYLMQKLAQREDDRMNGKAFSLELKKGIEIADFAPETSPVEIPYSPVQASILLPNIPICCGIAAECRIFRPPSYLIV